MNKITDRKLIETQVSPATAEAISNLVPKYLDPTTVRLVRKVLTTIVLKMKPMMINCDPKRCRVVQGGVPETTELLK